MVKTIAVLLNEATATIGEKLTLRRVSRTVKDANQLFGAYKHMGGRIAVLTVLQGGNDACCKDLAMHIAAQKPLYLSQDDISADFIAAERDIPRSPSNRRKCSRSKTKTTKHFGKNG